MNYFFFPQLFRYVLDEGILFESKTLSKTNPLTRPIVHARPREAQEIIRLSRDGVERGRRRERDVEDVRVRGRDGEVVLVEHTLTCDGVGRGV